MLSHQLLLNYMHTPYTPGQNIDNVIRTLENDSVRLFKWFSNNQMKANKDKCHLLLSNKERVTMKIGETEIKSSNCEKLLGIKIDNNLTFNEHLNHIIGKASRKTNALSRVAPYMNESKKRILMNSFFWSQFRYCPLVWVLHSRTLNNKINRQRARCLKIVYNDKKSTYENLLLRDRSVSVRVRNLQILAIEMFKVHSDLSPPIFKELFHKRTSSYELRHPSQVTIPRIESVYNGSESIAYVGPKIWGMVPSELKEMSSISSFKKEIKEWHPSNCPCRLCKRYLGNIGFI